jgi:hypothetical protein
MEYLKKPEGASPEELQELSRLYVVTLPQDLRDFMADSNGPILWFGFKELQFLRTSDILRDEYAVRIFMPGCIPLCMDGQSNICLAKINKQEVVGYYVASCNNLGWDDAVRISETFSGLLADSCSPEQRLSA